jgi:hypothetical protein
MDFMYKKRDELIDREEYLKGKRVDKTFEEFSKGEPENGENCVEHEVLPASISRRNQKNDSNEQVDLFRKQMEDPLMIIAKKTFEAAQKKFSTPESLVKIHKMLKEEKVS